MGDLWTYERFVPGQVFGSLPVALDGRRCELARAIYGEDGPGTVEAMMVAAMMEAYIATIQPRPPGNVHIGQELVFEGIARPGEVVTFTISCAGKEIRGTSRRVTFGVSAQIADRVIMTGQIRSIWAA